MGMSASFVACDPRAIAALVRANHLAALDRLTRCHGERLLAVARRRCRNDEDAHDAVQDALVSAGTHLQDFQGTGSVEGWVIRMVARACGRLRRGRKNDPSLHETEVDVPDVSETDPEFLTGRAELAAALGEAMLELSPEDRALLVLAEAEGWTGPEIAAETGASHDVVRARLSRARRKMRASLEQRLGDAVAMGPVTVR